MQQNILPAASEGKLAQRPQPVKPAFVPYRQCLEEGKGGKKEKKTDALKASGAFSARQQPDQSCPCKCTITRVVHIKGSPSSWSPASALVDSGR